MQWIKSYCHRKLTCELSTDQILTWMGQYIIIIGFQLQSNLPYQHKSVSTEWSWARAERAGGCPRGLGWRMSGLRLGKPFKSVLQVSALQVSASVMAGRPLGSPHSSWPLVVMPWAALSPWLWAGPETWFSPAEYGHGEGIWKMSLKSQISEFWVNQKGDYPGQAWLDCVKSLKRERAWALSEA